MYRNLNFEIELIRINEMLKRIAEMLDITVDELKEKLEGDKPFTLSEMWIIQKSLFPDKSLEYLTR